MKTFVAGLIFGVLAVIAAAYIYFTTGMAPVAVTDPDMPFEKMLAHKALGARIDKEMPKSTPVAADESNFRAGVTVYKENCAVCHGLPTGEESKIAKGMYPHPPQLFNGKGVTDDEPGETYWKVANGIRLTGMPGFKARLSETEMWQVSLLLAKADKIGEATKQTLLPSAPLEPVLNKK
jgi:mono/diheme cytochrome c family protein